MKKLFLSLGIATAILGIASVSQATLLSFNNGTISLSDESSGDLSFSWDSTTSSGYYSSLHDALSQWSNSSDRDGGYQLYGGGSFRFNQVNWNTSASYGGGQDTAPVPEPATMLLFGSGMIGLASLGLRKNRKQQ
jgi:hypothetical protein